MFYLSLSSSDKSYQGHNLVLIFIAEGREFEEVTELTGGRSLWHLPTLSFNSSDNEKYAKMKISS